MNNSGLWRGLAIAAFVIVAAAAVGIGAYNQGVAQGLAQSGAMASAPAGEPAPHPNPYGYGWHRPWGGGFFPFFLMLFLFFALKGLLWRGYGGRGWRDGYPGGGVPPAFEEWHRRAHADSPPKA
jgi:hypothetical protein